MCNSGPELVYFIYAPVLITILFLGFFVLLVKRDCLSNRLFFLLTTTISLWLFFGMMNWASTEPYYVELFDKLSLIGIIMPTIVLYFSYSFANEGRLSTPKTLFATLPLIPFILFAGTSLNIKYLDVSNSECESVYGLLYLLMPFVVFLYISWSIVVLYKKYKVGGTIIKNQIFLILSGFVFFLVWSTIVNVIFQLIGLEQFSLLAPIGVLILIIFMAYAIVQYQLLSTKIILTQALVVALIILIGSQFFFVKTTINYLLVSFTLFLSVLGGYFLIRSVQKEVRQREELQELTEELSNANDQLKVLDKMKSEFVSIASHQLRSPLTSIRGYASMLAEGSYGKLPAKANEAVQNIADSSMFMVRSVEDYLNVSRIEAGNMKYEMTDFSFKDTAEKIVDEMRSVALKKGLVLIFRSDCSSTGMIYADIGKTRQIIQNILDNSMKYTPSGTIKVFVHDDLMKKKITITIQDTGIGMSKETQEEVFDKFVRAKNANSVNVTGTGLGLYVAKKMVTEMKGTVWAESEGDGKGSTFHIEFPLVIGK